MAEFPKSLRYAKTHEWAVIDDDGLVVVGISDFAQESLGDVVHVELPELHSEVDAGQEVAVVESVKAASDLYAPVDGTVAAINQSLEEYPETVNESPYRNGWFFKLEPKDPEQVNGLLSAADYAALCEAESP